MSITKRLLDQKLFGEDIMGRKLTKEGAEKRVEKLRRQVYNIERDLYLLGNRLEWDQFDPGDLEEGVKILLAGNPATGDMVTSSEFNDMAKGIKS
jgi:hypothetical protein